jgi:hypothetical protein
MESYLRVNLLGPGPSSYKKRICRAAGSQRLRNTGLRRVSTATRLLGLWVRILSTAWNSASCECLMFSGRGLCDGPILVQGRRTECVVSKSDTATLYRKPKPTSAIKPQKELPYFPVDNAHRCITRIPNFFDIPFDV